MTDDSVNGDGATMALFRRHIDAEAIAFAWTRIVEMDQQQWVGKRSGRQPSGETRNVQRHRENYWETVTDWQPGPPNADGTPGPQQAMTRQELRTRTVYTYEALEWREGRTVTASGADRDNVHWPEYTLAPGSGSGARPRPIRSRSPRRPRNTRRPSTKRSGARLPWGPPTGWASVSWEASAK
jgi:hypothetical protein